MPTSVPPAIGGRFRTGSRTDNSIVATLINLWLRGGSLLNLMNQSAVYTLLSLYQFFTTICRIAIFCHDTRLHQCVNNQVVC